MFLPALLWSPLMLLIWVMIVLEARAGYMGCFCMFFLSFWLFSLPLGRMLDMTTIMVDWTIKPYSTNFSYLVLTFPRSMFQPNLVLLDNVLLGHLFHTALPYAAPVECCQPQAFKVIVEPGHEKMCHMSYANNKGADQPPRSLISTFVVCCLDSIMSLDSIAEISRL